VIAHAKAAKDGKGGELGIKGLSPDSGRGADAGLRKTILNAGFLILNWRGDYSCHRGCGTRFRVDWGRDGSRHRMGGTQIRPLS